MMWAHVLEELSQWDGSFERTKRMLKWWLENIHNIMLDFFRIIYTAKENRDIRYIGSSLDLWFYTERRLRSGFASTSLIRVNMKQM